MFRLLRSRKYDDIEPHEVLLDSLAKKKETEMGISEKKLEVPLLRIILQGFSFVCFLIILLLFAKTFQLQIVQGEEYDKLAQKNKFIISQIQAERGLIYDSNMEQLVKNVSSFDLICQKDSLPETEGLLEEVISQVSAILEEGADSIRGKIEESNNGQVLISENLDHQKLILLESKINELPGFFVKSNTIREYLDGKSFSHLIGYMGRITTDEYAAASGSYLITDYVGRTGVENYYEDTLKKNPGKLRIERDAVGNVLSQETISDPESGKSLVLWLDAALQKKIVEEVSIVLNDIGSKKASVVALNPKTGGVLALVSFPNFDNNLFQSGSDPAALQKLLADKSGLEPLFNRAVSGRYLIGSTIKPFIASAALEEHIITPDKKIYCSGKITIPHQYDPETEYSFTDLHSHGWTDMKKALAESCNVYFYTVGGGYEDQNGVGPTKIKEYLEKFGWSEKTGIDLPGEKAGFIPDKEWKKQTWKEGWWDGDTYNLSIGEGYLQITPLEVANAYAAIANGGTLYQPQVVQKIIDSSSKETVLETKEPVILDSNFISAETLEVIREGMRQTVTGENSPQATAIDLSYLPVTAAAKTGTAETYKEGVYHNWINAFAPYDDPEIVLTILLEDVSGVRRAVTPLAYNILNWYFQNKSAQ
jgi:penicillin-binding protein 2